MATAALVGKFPQTQLSWSTGEAFNGFALVGLIPPTLSGTDAANVVPQNVFPAAPLPSFALIPIIEGKYNSSVGLYFNADLNPPNSRYNVRFYDSNKRLITGPSAAFAVTADPIANTEITTVTLTAPNTGGTAPTPN